MDASEVIRARQEERGIPPAELARRCEIKYEALRQSLSGNRGITAAELVALCIELDLDIGDFAEARN